MTLRPGAIALPLGQGVGDVVTAGPFVRARVSPSTAHVLVAAAIVPMVAVTIWLGSYWPYVAPERLE
jgi:hypothetical protein